MAADLEQIRERGTLTVISFPHQESDFVRTNLDMGPTPALGPSSHFVGIDIELMEALAKRLGVELEVRRVSEPNYGALIPDLLAGRGDLIASSLSITPGRREQVDFSDPYFTVYKAVVARSGSTLASVDDLSGKRGAVKQGSSHHDTLRSIGLPAESIHLVSFTLECYEAVLSGEADFTVVDSAAAERQLRLEPKLQLAFNLPGEDSYGFAATKGSDALLSELNTLLAELRASGRLQEIIDRNQRSH
jgi:ABC-type amino acid transport substrate-binding protein